MNHIEFSAYIKLKSKSQTPFGMGVGPQFLTNQLASVYLTGLYYASTRL
jgi:hypothetical protein